uniref:Putative outcast ele5 orf2-h 1e-60-j 4 n=1 Tax=Ixodes ricinus TaxID=34613 RepID=A0A0K8RA63_IXORI
MVLKRNLKHASSDVKLTAYKTFILPILVYASVVWDPFTGTNINVLENVQRKSLRFIHTKFQRKYPVSELYALSGVNLLKHRRMFTRIKFLFDLLNNRFKINISKYISPAPQNYTQCEVIIAKTLKEFNCRINAFKYSFFPKVLFTTGAPCQAI